MDTAITALKPPRINTPWPGQGGIYAGIALGLEGAPDAHVILATAEPKEPLAWQAALDWAKGLEVDGHHDFAVPTRFQSALLYANVRGVLDEDDWHWTSTEYSERHAWFQLFNGGLQYDNDKSYEARARAVRLIPIID
jgi:hypothetical protein